MQEYDFWLLIYLKMTLRINDDFIVALLFIPLQPIRGSYPGYTMVVCFSVHPCVCPSTFLKCICRLSVKYSDSF